MNQHFMTRYERFCRSIQSMGRIKESNLGLEVHHIVPRSMGGDNSKDNLVVMTIREHFLAHIMLWLACDRGVKQAKMVLLMLPEVRQHTNCDKHSILSIKSRVVEQYRQTIYDSMKDIVYVTPVGSSDRVPISTEEYSVNKEEYTHHNSGKVTVFDIIEQKYVSIPTELYYEDDNCRYEWVPKSAPRQKYIHPETLNEVTCYESERPDGYVHWNSYHNLGSSCEWAEGKCPIFNKTTGKSRHVTLEEFHELTTNFPEKYCHPAHKPGVKRYSPKGTVPAFFISDQTTRSISKEEFNQRNNIDVVHACRKNQFLTEVIK